MSAPLHAPNQPHQRRHQPATSLGDWVEDAAVVLLFFSAAVVVATILALLIII